MTGKIFINYRRGESASTAGRLYDRLAQTFGRKNLFMDVDHIPAGADFVSYLNNQVAACDVFLAVIGPTWLHAKDESGARRLHDPDDYVTIEIAAALARGIPVIPVMVDGASMPKASELPDLIKPLVRRQAVEVRHAHFGRDVEALMGKVRGVLNAASFGLHRWRGTAVGVAAAVILILGVWMGAAKFSEWMPWAQSEKRLEAELQRLKEEVQRQAKLAADAEAKLKTAEAEQAKAAADAEAKRKAAEAEQQKLAAIEDELKRQAPEPDQLRQIAEAQAKALAAAEAKLKTAEAEQAKAAADAEAKRKAAEAEQQWLAEAKRRATEAEQQRLAEAKRRAAEAEQQRLADEQQRLAVKAEAEAAAKRKAEEAEQQRLAALKADAEAKRLPGAPASAGMFYLRGNGYVNEGDNDRGIAAYNEAIRLDPNFALAFANRGVAYANKGDTRRAIADYDEAIRLNPNYPFIFCNRGRAKLKINDASGNADIAKARELAASICQ